MMMLKCLLMIMLLGTTACFAADPDPYENEKSDKPRPYRITGIKSVTIDHSSEEIPEGCAKFTLIRSDVRSFFRTALRVSKLKYIEDLYMSRCYLSGKIVFNNNDRGEWEIDRARRGIIKLSDGRILYFYCPDCTMPVFDKVVD